MEMEDELLVLKQVNHSLLEELDTKEKEIEILKKQLEEFIRFDIGDDIKEQKILSLVKKNRNLTLLLNKEKAQSAQLAEKLKILDKNNQGTAQLKHVVGVSQNVDKSTLFSNKTDVQEESSDSELEHLIKEYKTKLERSVASCQELRETNLKLKQEVSKVKGILQKEIGDDLSIDEIVSSGGTKEGYRGRAQQILVLKSTIRDLRKQIEEGKKNSKLEVDSDTINNTYNTIDDKQRSTIEKIEKDRRLEVLDLKRQITEREEEVLNIKKVLEAKNARNITLEKANLEFKTKLDRILKKTENDDKLIDALRTELQSVKKGAMNESSNRSGFAGKSELELIRNYDSQISSLKKQNDQLNTILAERDEEISHLRQEIAMICKNDLETYTPNPEISIKEVHMKLSITKLELESIKSLHLVSSKRVKELEIANKDLLERVNFQKAKLLELEKKQQKRSKPTLVDEQDIKIQLDQMKSKMELLIDDNNVLKQTLDYTQANKDEEAKIYIDLLSKQKQQLQTFMDEVRVELEEKQNSKESTSDLNFTSGETDDLLEENYQLKEQIERLQSELVDLKSRYNTVALQLQNLTRKDR